MRRKNRVSSCDSPSFELREQKSHVSISSFGRREFPSAAGVLGRFGLDAFEDAGALAKLEPDGESTRQGLEDELGPAIESSQVQLDRLHAERRHFAVDREAVSSEPNLWFVA